MTQHSITAKKTGVSSFAFVLALAFSCGMLFSACEINVGSVPMGDTVAWDVTADARYVQYRTNDPANSGYLKYTTLSTSASSTNGITMNVVKKSGSAENGIGMVFFFQDSDDFFFALVSANGRYCIKKYDDSELVTIQEWKYSPAIRTGYGVVNMLSVQYEAWGRYGFYVNGEKQGTLYADVSLFGGGKYGPAVAVGYPAREDFPGVPVDAYFAVTSPNAYPVGSAFSYRGAANESGSYSKAIE